MAFLLQIQIRRAVDYFEVIGPVPSLGEGIADAATFLPGILVLLGIAAWAWFRTLAVGPPFLALLLAFLGSLAVAPFVDRLLSEWLGGSSVGSWQVSFLISTAFLGGGSFLVTRRMPAYASLRLHSDGAPSLWWIGVQGAALSILLYAGATFLARELQEIAPTPGWEPLWDWGEFVPPWQSTALMALHVVVFAPIAEEIAFRGALQSLLRRCAGPRVSIGLTALVFALFHPDYGVRMLEPFALGLAFGWTRERSGGLRVPIVLHMAVNLVATWNDPTL